MTNMIALNRESGLNIMNISEQIWNGSCLGEKPRQELKSKPCNGKKQAEKYQTLKKYV